MFAVYGLVGYGHGQERNKIKEVRLRDFSLFLSSILLQLMLKGRGDRRDEKKRRGYIGITG